MLPSGNVHPGIRFDPTEDELILDYLKPLSCGENVPGRNRVVFDCDLYGDQEPWEIWEEFKTRVANDLRRKSDIYFFTQLKISSTDDPIERNVGSGCWNGDDADAGKPIICDDTGAVLGLKKRFTYKNEESEQNGCWVLFEFSLDQSLTVEKQNREDYVLCLLHKNDEPKSLRRTRITKTKLPKKRKELGEKDGLEQNDASDCGEFFSTGELLI